MLIEFVVVFVDVVIVVAAIRFAARCSMNLQRIAFYRLNRLVEMISNALA